MDALSSMLPTLYWYLEARIGRTGETRGLVLRMAPYGKLRVAPLTVTAGLRKLACDAIKQAITEMDIYGQPGEIRLDERQLSEDLGVSRTPIREAITMLVQEGFVRAVPRRGIYVVRKTKREIIEMITVWAAIESLAAHMACERATDEELRRLRAMFAKFGSDPSERISEYSQANMEFHKAIIRMGGCELMTDLTENLFIHMRAIRDVTIRQDNRCQRSIIDHMNIIEALERRDADLAARRVREHTFGLAAHVEKYGDHLHDIPELPGKSMDRKDLSDSRRGQAFRVVKS
jgi:DNA-binding GntR family transcriptional regulator